MKGFAELFKLIMTVTSFQFRRAKRKGYKFSRGIRFALLKIPYSVNTAVRVHKSVQDHPSQSHTQNFAIRTIDRRDARRLTCPAGNAAELWVRDCTQVDKVFRMHA